MNQTHFYSSQCDGLIPMTPASVAGGAEIPVIIVVVMLQITYRFWKFCVITLSSSSSSNSSGNSSSGNSSSSSSSNSSGNSSSGNSSSSSSSSTGNRFSSSIKETHEYLAFGCSTFRCIWHS